MMVKAPDNTFKKGLKKIFHSAENYSMLPW